MSDKARKGNFPKARSTGVSLVEVIVVVSVIGILASLAFPSFLQMFARSRLKATAEQVRADLNLARSEALKRNQTIIMSFTVNSDSSWCYGLKATIACDCTVTDTSASNFCQLDRDAGGAGIPTAVSSTSYPGITFSGSPFGGSLSFSPVRPSLTASSATLASTNVSGTIRVVASGLGRVRFCSPSGGFGGYPTC